jgi:drug/metabolite transporter (DMT)-like permease
MATARIYIALATLLFATGGTAIKLSLLSSWQIAGLRSGIAAIVLAVAIPAWRGLERRVLLVGSTFAATMILFVTANTLTTAANAIFLQTTAPLYVLLLGPLLLREPLRKGDLKVAAVLAAGAVLFFLGAESPVVTAPNPSTGNVVAAAAGVTWALTVLGLRWLGREPSPAELAPLELAGHDPAGSAVVLGNVLAFLFCLPFALPIAGSTTVDWLIVGYLGVFQIGLAYVCLANRS